MNNKNWKLIVMAVFTFSFLSFNLALAQANQCPANAPGCTDLVVEIPGVGKQVTDPVQYILGVYKFGLAAGGLIAMLIIVFAAIERIVSAGNPSKIYDANDRIKNAIWGLALLLGAFLILSTINPELVKLQKPNLPKVTCTPSKDNDCSGLIGVPGSAKAAIDRYEASIARQNMLTAHQQYDSNSTPENQLNLAQHQIAAYQELQKTIKVALQDPSITASQRSNFQFQLNRSDKQIQELQSQILQLQSQTFVGPQTNTQSPPGNFIGPPTQ